jgi:AraC-like DNA-binding protein
MSNARPIVSPERHGARRFFVDVTVARRITVTPQNWRLRIRSPFWRIYGVDGEGAELRWAGGGLRLEPERLCLVPAWLDFETETRRELRHDYMHFYFNGPPVAWVRDSFAGPLVVARRPVVEALAATWREALAAPPAESWLARQGWGAALAQAAVAVAIEDLPRARRASLQGWLQSDAAVRAATERILRDPARPPRNEELAAACGLGVDQLARRFKSATGLTPTQYRLESAVEEAARRLAETEEKLEEIAEATGFTDRFYLSRVFKARLGFTPAAYRRAHRREGGVSAAWEPSEATHAIKDDTG